MGLTAIAIIALFLAQSQPGEDRLARIGFDHFYNLEYPQAIAAFEEEIAAHPDDPEAYNHLADAILYREMYRDGALESQLVSGTNPFLRRQKMNPTPRDQMRFNDATDKAMALANAALSKNPKDVAALYSLGVSYGQRSTYTFLVRKAWRDSLRDITMARRLHNQVTALDPAFIDARLVQGVHDYVVGSLPWTWRLLGFLAGFHGDRDAGIRELQLVASKGEFNRVDAQILLAAVYRREHEPAKAIPLIRNLIGHYPRNYLLRFELSQAYADLGDGARAIEVLNEIERMKKDDSPGYARIPEERIAYAEGNVHFWYREYADAVADLKRTTANVRAVDLNTGVMAWMRLGQTYDMLKEREEAVAAYHNAIRMAPDSDVAKECRGYLSRPFQRPA
jgi:tetratricopeptide (TPR) repeat protein